MASATESPAYRSALVDEVKLTVKNAVAISTSALGGVLTDDDAPTGKLCAALEQVTVR